MAFEGARVGFWSGFASSAQPLSLGDFTALVGDRFHIVATGRLFGPLPGVWRVVVRGAGIRPHQIVATGRFGSDLLS